MLQSQNFTFVSEGETLSTGELELLFHGDHSWREALSGERLFTQDASGRGRFETVGIFSIGNEILCVLPKFLPIQTTSIAALLKYTSTIIRVLKKYGLSGRASEGIDLLHSGPDPFFSELTLADDILTDYVGHGLYDKDLDQVRLGEEGEIDWNSTIDLLNPIFSQRSPIYLQTYRFSQSTEEFNIAREVQKWFVSHYLQKYGQLLDHAFTIEFDVVLDIRELGSETFILKALRSELASVYHDRRINLLKLLIASTQNTFNRNVDGPSMFAIRDFSHVWERVLSVALNNQRERFKHLIPKPEWHDLSHRSELKESFRPDIISQIISSTNTIFIVDAKYYNIHYSSGASLLVSGNPGLADVGKQFLYELVLDSVKRDKLFNCFAFPRHINSDFELFGYVTIRIFPGKRVWLLYFSGVRAFDCYLKNRPILEARLPDIATTIESHGR